MKVLTRNITGPASRTVYGKENDPVEVIPFSGWSEMILVECNGQRFWVFESDLKESNDSNEKNSSVTQVVEKGPRGFQSVHKVKGRR